MELASIIISSVFLIVSSALTIRSRIPNQTIASQKDLIETYEKRLKALEDQSQLDKEQYMDSVKAIAELRGQISVYKDLPLQQLAESMRMITETNLRILAILEGKAQQATPPITVIK